MKDKNITNTFLLHDRDTNTKFFNEHDRIPDTTAYCAPDPLPAFCYFKIIIAKIHFCSRETHFYKKIQRRDKISSTILAACCYRFCWWQKWRFGAEICSVLKAPLILIIFIFHSIIFDNIIEVKGIKRKESHTRQNILCLPNVIQRKISRHNKDINN